MQTPSQSASRLHETNTLAHGVYHTKFAETQTEVFIGRLESSNCSQTEGGHSPERFHMIIQANAVTFPSQGIKVMLAPGVTMHCHKVVPECHSGKLVLCATVKSYTIAVVTSVVEGVRTKSVTLVEQEYWLRSVSNVHDTRVIGPIDTSLPMRKVAQQMLELLDLAVWEKQVAEFISASEETSRHHHEVWIATLKQYGVEVRG
jgi:hypothetical protein